MSAFASYEMNEPRLKSDSNKGRFVRFALFPLFLSRSSVLRVPLLFERERERERERKRETRGGRSVRFDRALAARVAFVINWESFFLLKVIGNRRERNEFQKNSSFLADCSLIFAVGYK